MRARVCVCVFGSPCLGHLCWTYTLLASHWQPSTLKRAPLQSRHRHFFLFQIGLDFHPSLCFCFQIRETPTVPWTAKQKWPRGDESICQGARTAHAAAAAATANNKEALRQSGGEVRNLFLHSSQSSRFESLIRSLLFPHAPAGGRGLKIPQQRLCLEVFPCSPSLAA